MDGVVEDGVGSGKKEACVGVGLVVVGGKRELVCWKEKLVV